MLEHASILHPTDFSPFSEHAFRVACALAHEHGGRVIVLHVGEPPIIGYGGPMTPPPGGDRNALEEKLHRIQAPNGKVPVEHRLEEGDPVTEILRVATETKCDLIVAGTHGRTGLAHLLMGSVAEQLVRKATCNVLVVKTPFPKSSAA